MCPETSAEGPARAADLGVGDRAPSPFDGLVGLRVTDVSAERVVGVLDADERHHQPAGFVHGGVYCAMIETLASVGAWLHVHPRGARVAGVHNATDFLRSHRSGPLRGVAEPLHVGRSQQLWQVTITRDDGKSVATGQVRLQVVADA